MRIRKLLPRLALSLLAASLCLSPSAEGQSPSTNDVLGFECGSCWSPDAGSGTLTATTDSSFGASALRIGGAGYRRIRGGPLAVPTVAANTVRLDVKVASQASSWEGVAIVLAAPSVGLYWVDLGQATLAGAPLNQFVELQFVLQDSVRAALSSGASDLTVRVVVNADREVTVDNLRFQNPGPPPRPNYTDIPVDVGMDPGAFCTAHPLELLDLKSEFQDVWRGNEVASDGKLVGQRPSVDLTFDAPAIPSTIHAWYTPEPSCAGERVRLRAQEGAADWLALTSLPGQQRLPGDFNLVVLNSVNGTQFAGGAIAAGGQVMLGGFSINHVAHRPVGLIANEALLSSGSIFGGVLAQNAGPHQTTSLQGGAWQIGSPVSLGDAFDRLERLSTRLRARGVTGSATLQSSTLTFSGAEPDLNVFQVSAVLVRDARSIVFSIPAGSSALVSIEGTDVVIENAGVSLGSASAERVLWNLSEARTARIASIALPGSVLAPLAAVAFPSGQLDGTLVARTLTGAGALHHRPLDATSILGGGGGLSPVVTLTPERALEPGCEYAFQLHWASTSQTCLLPQDDVPFRVAELGSDIPESEIISLRRDAGGRVKHLAVRPGVNTKVDDFWDRYSIAPDEPFVESAHAKHAPGHDDQRVSHFGQTRGGYPVVGGGYQVWRTEDGFVRKVFGALKDDFARPVPQTPLDAAAARGLAAQTLQLTVAPWQTDPLLWTSPSVSYFYAPSPAGYVLVAQVDFRGSGTPSPFVVWLDAENGQVVLVHSGLETVFDPIADQLVGMEVSSATFPGQDSSGNAVSLGTQPVTAARYRDAADAEHLYLLTGDFRPRVSSGGLNMQGPAAPGVWVRHSADEHDFIEDMNGDAVFSASDSEEVQVASTAYWAATETFSFLHQLSLEFDGQPWHGADGYGEAYAEIISLDPIEDSDTPNQAFAGWASSILPPNAPPMRQGQFPEAAKMELYMIPAESGTRLVTPEVMAHEIGHAMFAAVHLRSGLPHGVYSGQRGAISEGVADLVAMATKERRFTSPASPEWWKLPEVQRDLAVPESFQYPSYVGSTLYGMPDSPTVGTCDGNQDSSTYNDLCHVHTNSTVVGHWAYLLARGNGVVGRCNTLMDPLAPTPADSVRLAIQIAMDAWQLLDDSDGFLEFAELTYSLAQDRYAANPRIANAVATAWYLVGVNVFAPDEPLNGGTGVDAFQNQLAAGLPPRSGNPTGYEVYVSTDETFPPANDQTRFYQADTLGPSPDGLGTLLVEDAFLDAGRTYYWKVVPEGEDPEECSFGTWTFETSPLDIELHKPTETHSSGALMTDFLGLIRIQAIPGAERYRLVLSEEKVVSDGCEGADSFERTPALGSGNFNDVYLGDSFDQGQGVPVYPQDGRYDGKPEKLVAFQDIELDQNYYLYVRAEKGEQVGTCTEFRIRKPDLGSFARIRPTSPWASGQGDITQVGVNLDRVPAASTDDDAFVFTPASGAVSYRLEVRSWYYPEEDLFDSAAVLYDEERDAGDPCLDEVSEGDEIAWRFDGDCGGTNGLLGWVAERSEPVHWRVFAMNTDGIERQAGTDGGSASEEADFAFQIEYLPPGPDEISLEDGDWIRLRFEKTGDSPRSPEPRGQGSLEPGYSEVTPLGEDEAWVIEYDVDVWADDGGGISSFFNIEVARERIPLANSVYVAVWADDDVSSRSEVLLDATRRTDPAHRVDYNSADPDSHRFNILLLPYAHGVALHPTVLRVFPHLRTPAPPEPPEPEPDPELECWDPNDPPKAVVPFPTYSLPGLIEAGTFPFYGEFDVELPLVDEDDTQSFTSFNALCLALINPAENHDIVNLSVRPFEASHDLPGSTGWQVYATRSIDSASGHPATGGFSLLYDSESETSINPQKLYPCSTGCFRDPNQGPAHLARLYTIGTLVLPYQDCGGQRVYAQVGPEHVAISSYYNPLDQQKCGQ